MIIKTIVMMSIYILPFIAMLALHPPLWLMIVLSIVMGIGIAGIGMNVMHDANHGSYSDDRNINKWLGHTLNMLGGSVVNWKMQHNNLHHTYTNVAGIDQDIKDRVILRFNPHTEVKKVHKYQHYFAFVMYGLMTLYWTFAKDFQLFFQFVAKENSKKDNIIFFIKLLLDKIIYLFVMLVLPVIAFNFTILEVVTVFIIMQFTGGLILSVIFQMAHTVEGTEFPLPDENGLIDNNWAIHQMATTCNFAKDNKLITWYTGGLNFQVEHHLFPKICHVHYPQIALIVKETAHEFGIPYLENNTFSEAINSHISVLKQFGREPMMEVIG
jgi:linoleoyl-CoA desaturase